MRSTGTVGTLCLISLFATAPALDGQGLPAPICDASPAAVARDAASLRETVRESLVFLLTDTVRGLDLRTLERIQASIEIESVGPGRVVRAPADDPTRRDSSAVPPGAINNWVGVNPATCNQFRIRVPEQTRNIVAGLARDKGLARANPGPGFRADDVVRPGDWNVPQGEQYGPPQTGPYFSGCVDTRIRWGTAGGPHRALADFSADGQMSSCTGTMVGPRHVITAAHCVFLGGNWNDFLVIPARDGASWPVGSTQMSDTQGLNSGFRWYWIPEPLFDNPGIGYSTGLDIAFLILPKRLGEGTGWMGVVARSDAALMSTYHRNLGYPGQPGQPIGLHPSQVEGGLYGDINRCDVGDFTFPDADGWGRVADHSCDNSPGHSGGPIFHWFFDSSVNTIVPVVSMLISGHPAFVNDFDCANDPRPYQATRVTPEYVQWFLFFRSWKP